MPSRQGVQPHRRRLLSLALSGALSALAPGEVGAQTFTIGSDTVSGNGIAWPAGDLWIANGVNVVATQQNSSAVNAASALFGTLFNEGGTLLGGGAGLINQSGGNIAAVDNRGDIIGGNVGVHNIAHIGAVINSGRISGGYAGIRNTGSVDVIHNQGVIEGSNYGIAAFGAIGTINNDGSIVGSTGIEALISSVAVLNNRGLIRGSNLALSVQALAGQQVLYNAGTIAGDIAYLPETEFLIEGGSGMVFGTLTGASGHLGAADIGMLNAAGNVRFVGGNQILNDHIQALTHTVFNEAAHLQVNQRLTINSNYQQSAGAALLIGVSDAAVANGSSYGDSGYGQLWINGSATIASGSTVALRRLNNYAFAPGQRFVVVLADSADYHADTLQYLASGYRGPITGASVSDNGKQALVLTLASGNIGGGSGGIVDNGGNAASNRHARTVLDALYRYEGVHSDMLDIYNPARALTDTASANYGGLQLTPVAVTGASARAARATFSGVFKAAAEHIDGARSNSGGSSGVASGEAAALPGFWLKAFGGRVSQGEHDEAGGYHGNFRGMLAGADGLNDSDWRAGALASYGTAVVANDGSNSGSSVTVKTLGLAAYAAYDTLPWYAHLMIGAARQRFNTARVLNFNGVSDLAGGSFDGLQYLASAQAGYPLWIAAATTMTPLAGLSFSTLRQDGYTEHGGAAALSVRAAASTSLKGNIGVRLAHTCPTAYGDLTPSLQLGWRHEFHASRLYSEASFVADASNASDFVTSGLAPIRDTGVLGFGLQLAYGKHLSVAANLVLEAGHGYTSQSADVRVRWQY